MFQVELHHGVAGLVIGDLPLLHVGHHARLAFRPHDHALHALLHFAHRDRLLVAAGRQDGRLVDQVLQVSAAEAGGDAGDGLQLDIRGHRLALGVHAQDIQPPLDVRIVHHHLAVEATRAQQRRIEDVGAVGGCDDDDVRALLEAVHLDEDLIERLLALVVAAAQASAAMAAHSVDLIDEDDGRGFRLGALEQVTHAAGADADEHLDELRAGDAEERHTGLACHRAGHERLAGPWRAHHQHALRDARTESDELVRLLEELDHFGQFLLGLFGAGDIGEGHLRALHVAHHAGTAAAKAERLVLAAAHRAHHAPQQPDDDERGHDGDEQLQDQAAGVVALLLGILHIGPCVAGDAIRLQGAEEIGLALLVVVGGRAVAQLDEHIAATAHGDAAHVALLELAGELIQRDAVAARDVVGLAEDDGEQHQHHDAGDDPQPLRVAVRKGRIAVAGVPILVGGVRFVVHAQVAPGTRSERKTTI